MSNEKTRGRPRLFDDNAVAETALAILDEGGQLSIRSVALRLGVAPNAIYTYVGDRAGLERAVIEQVLGTVDLALLDGTARSWRKRLRNYAIELRTVLLAHPGAVSLFMTAPMDGPAALVLGERMLQTLVDGGLESQDAAKAVYLLITYVLGTVALEVAETDGRPPLDPESERIAGRAEKLSQLDPQYFPLSAATAGTSAAWIGTEQFVWGLDAVLSAISN